MTPEDIERILDYILETLGPTGKHLLELAIRQSISFAVLDLLFGLLLLAVGFTLVYFARRLTRAINGDDELPYRDTTDIEIMRAISFVISVFAFFIAVPIIGQGLWRLLNPELSAIIDLIHIVKP